MYSLGP